MEPDRTWFALHIELGRVYGPRALMTSRRRSFALALTIRQPWAWAIIHAGKNVENRSWSTDHRGPLVIHAGRRIDPNGVARLRELGLDPPDETEILVGGIIGQVELTGVRRDDPSRWAVPGAYHWQLADARALPFEPLRGCQTLWRVALPSPPALPESRA